MLIGLRGTEFNRRINLLRGFGRFNLGLALIGFRTTGASFLILSAIGFGYRLDLGIGTGRFVLGFGVGFSGCGGTYFVVFKSSGSNFISFDFNGFNLLPLGKNFIFVLGTVYYIIFIIN